MPELTRRSPTRTFCAVLALAGLALSLGELGTPALEAQTVLRTDLGGGAAQLPGLWAYDASIAEGGEGARKLVFTLNLSEPSSDTVSVDVSTADSTATIADGDFEAASMRLTFAPGSVAESLSVTVFGDTKYEADELLLVRLSSAVGAVLADSEAIGTILDDDPPAISVADTSIGEGDTGTRVLSFRVCLDSAAKSPVRFRYYLLDGTATIADRDYLAASQNVTIEPGLSQALVEVMVRGDSLLEANERFTIRVFAVQGALPAELTAIGTICNDERTSFEKFIPPVPRFSSGTLTPAWGDFDADGRVDLPLYANDGVHFAEMPGIRSLLGNGNYHGAAWCDYDRDGDQDLLVMPYANTQSSFNFTHLFENTPTGLQEVAPSLGMDIVGFGETPSWGDFNADGWPDLFLPFYSHVSPFRSYFYLNVGSGQFLEAADSAGISMRSIPAQLKPEGVGVADWNGDGTLDVYCASHLFLNDGDAHFTNVRAQVGLPAVFDEGAQFLDFDDDGDLDLYLRTGQGPTLYRNDDGFFHDATPVLGIGSLGWSWGDRWADLDGDGDLDLIYFPPGEVVRLQLNNGDGSFSQDTSFTGVLDGSFLSAFADMDEDGDLDIAIGDWDRQIARNRLERVPNAHASFLKVRVEDETGRLTAFGASVRLRSLNDPKHPVQTRIVDGGSGYLGQDEYTITFGGVGSGSFDLEVAYPSKPGSPRVVGPVTNALLHAIRPGLSGPQLVIVRPNGQVDIQEVVATAGVAPPLPMALPMLSPASPNPARSATRFDLTLAADGEVSLTILDLSGRRIRTLVRGGRRAVSSSVTWDLRDDSGRSVPAGLYFARVQRGEQGASVRPVVVLR